MTHAYLSVVADSWLYQTITALPEVSAAFPEVIRGYVPPEIEPPYLVIIRHPGSNPTRTMSGLVIAETYLYDIVGWAVSRDTTPILAAMEAVDGAICCVGSDMHLNHQIVTRVGSELPPENRPIAGVPPSERLGKQYAVFVAA